jgi:TolA-binding protein
MIQTIAALALTMFLSACGGGAKEMLETARFEELQRNTKHARELYQEILQKHPDSPEAAKAKERLAVLDSAPAN